MTKIFVNISMLTLLAISLLTNPLVAQTAPIQSKQTKSSTSKQEKTSKGTTDATSDVPAALNFTMMSIDGEEIDLSKYKGNVVMFVNVASKCGRTPQYEQLQAMHEQYSQQGLSIIGIPCNQFGGQEPGTETEIATFCQKNYGVEFDLLSKVDVKDDDKCELYEHLTDLDLAPVGKGEVAWNFEKIIVDRKGEPIGRFGSKVKPDNQEILTMIEAALAEKVVSHFSQISKKLGKTYYLFKKDVPRKNSDKLQTLYFFAKDPNNKKGTPLASVPEGKEVSETKNGMLVLKNKK